ncbi:MAG: VanW family protein [Actinomycetota bacterium]
MSTTRRVRARRRGLPKPIGVLVVGVVALLLLSALLLIGFRVVRAGTLPNMELAGTDVGKLSRAELRDAIAEIEKSLRSDPIVIKRPRAGRARAVSLRASAGDVGYEIDVVETVEEIMARGRQGNPVVALIDQVRATFSTIPVDPIDDLDSGIVADEVASRLASPFFSGGFRVSGREVTPRYPEPGVFVEPDELEDEILDAAREPGPDEVTIDGDPVAPSTDRDDVDELVAEVERAVDGPVTFTRGPESVTFSPDEIGDVIRPMPTIDLEDLTLTIPLKRLRPKLAEARALETPPIDATFNASGSSVSVVPAQAGFELVPETTADQLLRVALREGGAEVPIKGKRAKPEFTTADARDLDVTEQVSTFTTYHSCCEPRVDNIHRIADLVDGVVVEPDESFSLNDHVGPRTTANGFVGAPSIRGGEFVEEVGGGISQFATTFFNAIFFGGYDLLVYQPHSYYISRYPPGREATISTPGPDLAFLNDSDAGVYIDTSYTEESITVSFYGSQDFDIESVTGPQKNVTPPKEVCRENEDLARGEENVVQEGITGFDIVVRRVFSDGRPDETFTTHYNMQPRIIEKRTCEKRKKR